MAVPVMTALGTNYMLRAEDDGCVYAHGHNGKGQCGTGGLQSGLFPLKIPIHVPGCGPITSLDAGMYHSVAVRNGCLYMAGNEEGTVGGADYPWEIYSEIPPWNSPYKFTYVPVPMHKKVAWARAGIGATLIGTDDAQVFCRRCIIDATYRAVPVWSRITVPGTMRDITFAAADEDTIVLCDDAGGWYGGCAPKAEDTCLTHIRLFSGGRIVDMCVRFGAFVGIDDEGALFFPGDDLNSPAFDPRDYAEMATMRMPGGRRAVAVSVGREHRVVAASDGTVWVWGSNARHQLGLRGAHVHLQPEKMRRVRQLRDVNIVAVAAMEHSTLFMANTGEVYGVGANGFGELGFSGADELYVPTRIPELKGALCMRDVFSCGCPLAVDPDWSPARDMDVDIPDV